MEYPEQLGITLDPEHDGLTHINVYSKAKTPLGKRLSHFSTYPFEHPTDGRFDTMEGYWMWLDSGCVHDEFRSMSGFNAKFHGRTVKRERKEGFKKKVIVANCVKLVTHPTILEEFLQSTLPLVHYYIKRNRAGQPYVSPANNSLWVIKSLEKLRAEGKPFIRNLLLEAFGESYVSRYDNILLDKESGND